MKKIISIIAILTMVCGLSSVAMANKENENISVKTVEISAEEIGIEEIENEVIEEIIENDVVESEDGSTDEPEVEEEPEIDNEPETVSPEPPVGKVEGYVEGTYFEPNENDCEICAECYSCEDDGHIYVHCVYMADRGYVLEEWCTICGHGTENPITDKEFEALGVECDVEF